MEAPYGDAETRDRADAGDMSVQECEGTNRRAEDCPPYGGVTPHAPNRLLVEGSRTGFRAPCHLPQNTRSKSRVHRAHSVVFRAVAQLGRAPGSGQN